MGRCGVANCAPSNAQSAIHKYLYRRYTYFKGTGVAQQPPRENNTSVL